MREGAVGPLSKQLNLFIWVFHSPVWPLLVIVSHKTVAIRPTCARPRVQSIFMSSSSSCGAGGARQLGAHLPLFLRVVQSLHLDHPKGADQPRLASATAARPRPERRRLVASLRLVALRNVVAAQLVQVDSLWLRVLEQVARVQSRGSGER